MMIYLLILLLLVLSLCLFRVLRKKRTKVKEEHLLWSHISGFGELECLDCGKKMWIYVSLHGIEGWIIGTQCQKCGTFFGTRIKFSQFMKEGEKDKDLVCTKCGNLCVSHEDVLKENDKPLFCPQCKSHRLKYTMDFTT